ncbi:MAG: DUF6491 family protein [Pseudomonadota bacterium]
MLRSVLTIGVLMLAGCAATPEQVAREAAGDARVQAKLDRKLAGFTPGPTVECIRPNSGGVTIFGDTLVYDDTGRRLYKTTTTGGCFGLKRDDIIVTRSFGSQICRGDIVRTVDRTSGFPSGACAFGPFVTYTRDRRG